MLSRLTDITFMRDEGAVFSVFEFNVDEKQSKTLESKESLAAIFFFTGNSITWPRKVFIT